MNFLRKLFGIKTPEEIDHERRIRLYKKVWKQQEGELKKREDKYLRTNPKIIVLKREYKQSWLKCLFDCLWFCTSDNDYERFERILRHAVKAGFLINDPVVGYEGLQQVRSTLLYHLISRTSSYSKESREKFYLEHVEKGDIEEYPNAYSLPNLPEESPFRTDPRYLNLLIELGANLNKIWDRDLVGGGLAAVDAAMSVDYKCPEWFIQTLRDHGGVQKCSSPIEWIAPPVYWTHW